MTAQKLKAPRLSQWNAQIKAGHIYKVQHDRMALQNISSERAVTFHANEHLYVPGDQQTQNINASPNGQTQAVIRPELYMNSVPSTNQLVGSPGMSPMQSPQVNGNAIPNMNAHVTSNGIPNMNLNVNSNMMVEYQIGDKVMVDESKMGQIKSIGQHPAWGKGMTFYGVRLTEKIGDSDGEFKGILLYCR